VAKTLLAVDDSVTMRKVLEITFSGEDFRVVTADTSQGALGKMSESPQVCVIDTALGGEDGYNLAKELRKRSPSTSIIMLASRYAPYDQARGRDAGADDWADKPFDTQQLIDKVRKVLLAKEAGAAAAPPAPAPSPQAPSVGGLRSAQPAAASALGKGTQPSLSSAVPGRTGTLLFGESGAAAPPAAAAAPPRPAPPAPPPPPAPVAAPAPPAASPPVPAAPVAAAVNGHLSAKLGDLGLSPQQAEAVMALSREVVERVVWEVVPQLAEALIKEEIARLTKE
jgi:CheY-like chemotaxis protein